MRKLLGTIILTLFALRPLAAQPACAPLPTLLVQGVHSVKNGDTLTFDRAIEGVATKDGKPLALAQVRLYSAGKLIRRVTTDKQGHFTLDNLSLRRYRLSFEGLGSFAVEVKPPKFVQQFSYGFGSINGCPSWGADSN
jgi:hypothetical protein